MAMKCHHVISRLQAEKKDNYIRRIEYNYLYLGGEAHCMYLRYGRSAHALLRSHAYRMRARLIGAHMLHSTHSHKGLLHGDLHTVSRLTGVMMALRRQVKLRVKKI